MTPQEAHEWVAAALFAGVGLALLLAEPVLRRMDRCVGLERMEEEPTTHPARPAKVTHEGVKPVSVPKQYRKKPVTIEAKRLTGTTADYHAVISWMEANRYPFLVGNALEPATLRYPDQADDDDSTPDKGIWIDPATGNLMIRTLEGDMRAPYGHWIIRGVQGEFYPCDPDIFAATYEEVTE